MKYVIFVVALLVVMMGVSAVDAGNTLYQNPTGAGQAAAVTADMCKGDSLTWTGSACQVKPKPVDEKLNCYKAGGTWTQLDAASTKYYCKDPNTAVFEREQEKSTVSVERSKVVGLENALIRVKYNQSRTVIEANIVKITFALQKDWLVKFENVTIEHDTPTNVTKLVGFRSARFLGLFPFQKKAEFDVNSAGTVTQKKGVFDFLSAEG